MTGEGQAVRLQDFGLEQLFWRLHEAMIVADAGSGRIVLWNPAAETLFGYSAAEAAGLIIDDLVPERLRDFARAGRARYAATGSGQHVDGTVIETVALHKTNGELPVELSYTPLSDSAVPGRFVLALIRGVADAGRNATVLYDSDERYRQIFATNQTVKLVIDPASGEIVDANQAAADFYGYSLEELKRMPLAALTDLSPEQLQADLALAAEEQRLYFLFRHRLASGQVRDVEVYSGPFDVRGRRLLYSVVHDITERKALEEQLRQHAFYDPLTALPNRALLMNRLDQALASAGRQQGVVAILFLDLDEFKLINDSLGHAVGDLLLTAVARRCSGYLRASDTLARFGGNEFLILIPHTTISSVPTHVAERILTALRQPFAIDGREIFITASLGVAIHHGAAGSTEPGDLLRQADIALYQAKAAGKARLVIFDPSMSAWARERLDLETDLRHAVERQELLLHYQPIVDVPSGSIIGMEALLRWQHPQRGLLGPMQFIPIAEQTELILPIGRWVLEQACRQAQAWRGLRTEGPPLVMSVNLSAREFQQRDLTEHVRQVLEETGLEPEMVELEITRAS